MPLWAPAHATWVWCRGVKSRAALSKQIRTAADSSAWEASLQRAARALLARKAALHEHILHSTSAGMLEPSGWRSSWGLISHQALQAGDANGEARKLLGGGCCGD